MRKMKKTSIIIPCRNESKTLPICITKIKTVFKKNKRPYEIIVSDNGSSDKSAKLASKLGATVIYEPKKGYGNSLLTGFRKARGDYVVFADADDSYNFLDINRFIKELDKGADVVLSSRLKGKIMKGAMPLLHRFIGTPSLNIILRILFGIKVSDSQSGYRAFKRNVFDFKYFVSEGMEFASEMLIKTAQQKLKVSEIPITYYKDKRKAPPHLRSFRDGWRHLRLMLLYSPIHLFFLPGLLLSLLGFFILFALLPGPIKLANLIIDIHTMSTGGFLAILGFQLMGMAALAKMYSFQEKLTKLDRTAQFINNAFNLEKGLLLGFLVLAASLILYIFLFYKWSLQDFKVLSEIRLAILASTTGIIGIQITFFAFFMGILKLKNK